MNIKDLKIEKVIYVPIVNKCLDLEIGNYTLGFNKYYQYKIVPLKISDVMQIENFKMSDDTNANVVAVLFDLSELTSEDTEKYYTMYRNTYPCLCPNSSGEYGDICDYFIFTDNMSKDDCAYNILHNLWSTTQHRSEIILGRLHKNELKSARLEIKNVQKAYKQLRECIEK